MSVAQQSKAQMSGLQEKGSWLVCAGHAVGAGADWTLSHIPPKLTPDENLTGILIKPNYQGAYQQQSQAWHSF